MRCQHISFLFCISLLAFIFLSFPHPSTATNVRAWLRMTTRAAKFTGTLENTCQCDCCYSIGSEMQIECVSPSDTSFDVTKCSDCDVDACSSTFPIACAQSSSSVNAECIKRKGWMLLLVPVVFIGATVILLIYGLCFKTYDGYHDEHRPARSNSTLCDVAPAHYATFPSLMSDYGSTVNTNVYSSSESERRGKHGRSSSLATISETAEVT